MRMNQESHTQSLTPSKLYGVLAVAIIALIVGIVGLTVSLTRDAGLAEVAPGQYQSTIPGDGVPTQPRSGGISGSSDGPTSGSLQQ